jgi:hypothetical protein
MDEVSGWSTRKLLETGSIRSLLELRIEHSAHRWKKAFE